MNEIAIENEDSKDPYGFTKYWSPIHELQGKRVRVELERNGTVVEGTLVLVNREELDAENLDFAQQNAVWTVAGKRFRMKDVPSIVAISR